MTDKDGMSQSPRTAAEILADLQALDRENDRLELQLAMVAQSLKAAEAHDANGADTDTVVAYLDRADRQLRKAG